MTDIIKDFYENKTGSGKPRGFMRWLFCKLEKFNTGRSTKCIQLVNSLKNKKNIKSYCDIGCNNGLLVQKISNILPNLEYKSGIDISEKCLSEAKKSIKDGDFYSCDINGEFVLHQKCDLVTCLAVIEHVFDPESVVKNISQNINRGGTLIIQVPNIVCITRRISFLFGNRPRTSWDAGRDGGHIAYFTKKDVINLFKDNGFKIEKVTGSGVFAPLRNRWVSMLSPDIICVGVKK